MNWWLSGSDDPAAWPRRQSDTSRWHGVQGKTTEMSLYNTLSAINTAEPAQNHHEDQRTPKEPCRCSLHIIGWFIPVTKTMWNRNKDRNKDRNTTRTWQESKRNITQTFQEGGARVDPAEERSAASTHHSFSASLILKIFDLPAVECEGFKNVNHFTGEQ